MNNIQARDRHDASRAILGGKAHDTEIARQEKVIHDREEAQRQAVIKSGVVTVGIIPSKP